MPNIEDVKKMLDDLFEDHREEGESIDDAYKSGKDTIQKALDDIAQDHREEGEELDKLRKELLKVTKERDQANNAFMKRENEDKKSKLDEIKEQIK